MESLGVVCVSIDAISCVNSESDLIESLLGKFIILVAGDTELFIWLYGHI